MFSMCFPDEVFDYGLLVDSGGGTNGVTLDDAYTDEMDMIGIGRILDAAPHGPHSTFDMFRVSMLEMDGDDSITDVATPDFTFVKGVSDLVDPPLSFDSMSGFVTHYDVMSDANNNEMSIFEYLPMSQHFPLIAPQAPTTQIHDIDDVGDPNGLLSGQSYCDSDSEQRKVTPVFGSTESYLDVLAWSYEDMPGLDPSIVKEEIQKQLSVGFLSMVEYPEWLANVVSIPKKNNKVRVCVSFRDLNKSSPKDDFPLPHIDMFVGSITGHSMLSFMDGVMPFGLKNAGATYQRAATTLFHDMKHKDVEFRLRLNPKKCTFGVASRKLLGHIVSEHGIKVDSENIRAILDMPALRTEREIRGFLGKLQYISRFIARLTDICELISRLLRKNQSTVWNDDY
ncbi:hypothetical protein CK203_111259 [Vitis vinifera]|uniref:Uncharacterized protein n=1 Tax=Vitis vinifera TaxID=29760 RepID=A0A438CE69_VITVI|nr:hypothetical protein CK203_111259 [Vitis vinifera]